MADCQVISCDVHGALNNWHESDPDQYQKSTENLLNSVTYGWWLDDVYADNDGDHVQLGNYYYDSSANAKLSSRRCRGSGPSRTTGPGSPQQ